MKCGYCGHELNKACPEGERLMNRFAQSENVPVEFADYCRHLGDCEECQRRLGLSGVEAEELKQVFGREGRKPRIANFLTLCEIWGYVFGVMAMVVLTVTWIAAYLTPEMAVVVSINDYGEANIELAVLAFGMIVTTLGWISHMRRMVG